MTVTVAMVTRLVEMRAHIAAGFDKAMADAAGGANEANLLGLLRGASQRSREAHGFRAAAAQ